MVPPVDAPNLMGAKGFGLVSADATQPTTASLRADVEAGRVAALFVLHPGPSNAFSEADWIAAARTGGKLPFLVVQSVLESTLTQAADVVLAGASWMEKDGAYLNMQGRLQRVSQAILPLGEARQDWQILVQLAQALQVPDLAFDSVQGVREAIAKLLSGEPAVAGIEELGADRPRSASNWLQASNPSERWKWDFLFQDLPPVKFHNMHAAGSSAQAPAIPLKPVR